MQVLQFAFEVELNGFDLSFSARSCCSSNLGVDIDFDELILSFDLIHAKRIGYLLFAIESQVLPVEAVTNFDFVRRTKSFFCHDFVACLYAFVMDFIGSKLADFMPTEYCLLLNQHIVEHAGVLCVTDASSGGFPLFDPFQVMNAFTDFSVVHFSFDFMLLFVVYFTHRRLVITLV